MSPTSRCTPPIIYRPSYSKSINYSSTPIPLPPNTYSQNPLLKPWTLLSSPSMILNSKIKLFCSRKSSSSIKKDIKNRTQQSSAFQLSIFITREEHKSSSHIPKTNYHNASKTRLFTTQCLTPLITRTKITIFLTFKPQSREKNEWYLASVISSRSKSQKNIDNKISN